MDEKDFSKVEKTNKTLHFVHVTMSFLLNGQLDVCLYVIGIKPNQDKTIVRGVVQWVKLTQRLTTNKNKLHHYSDDKLLAHLKIQDEEF